MASLKGKTIPNKAITAIITGTSIMALICGSLICIAPLFVLNGSVQQNSIKFLVLIIQFASSLIGSLIAGLMAKHNRFAVMMASGGLFYLLLICCAMLLFDGVSNQLLIGIITCGAGAICSSLILCKNKKTTNKKIKTRRNR